MAHSAGGSHEGPVAAAARSVAVPAALSGLPNSQSVQDEVLRREAEARAAFQKAGGDWVLVLPGQGWAGRSGGFRADGFPVGRAAGVNRTAWLWRLADWLPATCLSDRQIPQPR